MTDLLYGIHPVQEALRSRLGRQPVELLILRDGPNARLASLIAEAERRGMKTRSLDRRELDRLAGHPNHQGVLLRLSPFGYTPFADLLQGWRQSARSGFFLVLDGITDPHNFGAILRSAEVAGCHGVIVAKDRSCPVTATVEKTAAGALSHLPLCQVVNISRALEDLKQAGVWCYGLAGESGAQNLFRSDLRGDVAIVVGREGEGLRQNVRRHCDGLLAIPMAGRVGSLNASVAAGIALFEIVRQREGDDPSG